MNLWINRIKYVYSSPFLRCGGQSKPWKERAFGKIIHIITHRHNNIFLV